MSAPRKKIAVLYYPRINSNEFASVDTKFHYPLVNYVGSDFLADVFIHDLGDIETITRQRSSNDCYEIISVQRRDVDIRVIHTWYGECNLYNK